jgi:hypothetical protein
MTLVKRVVLWLLRRVDPERPKLDERERDSGFGTGGGAI